LIIKAGSESTEFFIIQNGKLKVKDENGKILATLRRGDVFGENALKDGLLIPRSADVVAETHCVLLSLSRTHFKHILEKDVAIDTKQFYTDVSRITRMRPFVANTLAKTYLFQDLSAEQIDHIASLCENEVYREKGTYIIKQEEDDTSLYIVEKGKVVLTKRNPDGQENEILSLGEGQIIGELALATGRHRTFNVIAKENTTLIQFKKETFDRLTKQYQNLSFKIANLVKQRSVEGESIRLELQRSSSTLVPQTNN